MKSIQDSISSSFTFTTKQTKKKASSSVGPKPKFDKTSPPLTAKVNNPDEKQKKPDRFYR